MDVVWLGHSSFRLRSGDLAVVTDPYPESLGVSMGKPHARVVTLSHKHRNHSNVVGITGEPYVADGPGEYELQGVYIRGLRTPVGPTDPPEKRNTLYVIDIDGVTLCHVGDLSKPLPAAMVEAVGKIDVLLVPAGGDCTINPREVVELVAALTPRLIIPMHYALPGLAVQLGTLEAFLKELGAPAAERMNRLVVTATNLPAQAKVVVLEQQAAR